MCNQNNRQFFNILSNIFVFLSCQRKIPLSHFSTRSQFSVFSLNLDTSAASQLVKYAIRYNKCPSFLCLCSYCFQINSHWSRHIGDKSNNQPHQSPLPIESWWQRENRESTPRLMCVARHREKGRERERQRGGEITWVWKCHVKNTKIHGRKAEVDCSYKFEKLTITESHRLVSCTYWYNVYY